MELESKYPVSKRWLNIKPENQTQKIKQKSGIIKNKITEKVEQKRKTEESVSW